MRAPCSPEPQRDRIRRNGSAICGRGRSARRWANAAAARCASCSSIMPQRSGQLIAEIETASLILHPAVPQANRSAFSPPARRPATCRCTLPARPATCSAARGPGRPPSSPRAKASTPVSSSRPARPAKPLFIYGAGHVGRAIVKAIAELDFAVNWVDVARGPLPRTPSRIASRRSSPRTRPRSPRPHRTAPIIWC